MEELTMTCEICGDTCVRKRYNQKYCPECGKAPDRARRRYKRAERVNRQHAGDLYPTYHCVCEECGKTFESHKWMDFCSSACMTQNKIKNLKCSWCGGELCDLSNRYGNIADIYFCSKKCHEEYRWDMARKNGNVHTCQFCGKEFMRKGNATFCGQPCYNKAVKNGWKPIRKPKPKQGDYTADDLPRETVKCQQCGKPFERIKGSVYDKYCSDSCRDIVNAAIARKEAAERKKRKEARIAAEQAKKAQKKNRNSQRGLCWSCKTSYTECERMQSRFMYSPKGAVFANGVIIECPKFHE